MSSPILPVDLSKMGPAMQALPNDSWRAAAIARFEVKPGHGAQARAYRAAGLGAASEPADVARMAHRMFHDPRMLAAQHELADIYLKLGVPDAIAACLEIIADPIHKDRARMALAWIERQHPTAQKIEVAVTHEIIDRREQEIEALRYQRDELGASREALVKTWGAAGLARIESNERESASASARIIEGEVAHDPSTLEYWTGI
jgi:hypothetical protein